MNHLYIRHTVGGRLFLDSIRDNLNYELQQADGLWKFIIDISDEAVTREVLQNRHELNIFVVKEGEPIQKSWYYSKNGLVEYHQDMKKLIILADVKIDYSV